jgi:hypothetical protein
MRLLLRSLNACCLVLLEVRIRLACFYPRGRAASNSQNSAKSQSAKLRCAPAGNPSVFWQGYVLVSGRQWCSPAWMVWRHQATLGRPADCFVLSTTGSIHFSHRIFMIHALRARLSPSLGRRSPPQHAMYRSLGLTYPATTYNPRSSQDNLPPCLTRKQNPL